MTVAPLTTAPCASRTEPLTDEVCAETFRDKNAAKPRQNAIVLSRVIRLMLFFMFPPDKYRTKISVEIGNQKTLALPFEVLGLILLKVNLRNYDAFFVPNPLLK